MIIMKNIKVFLFFIIVVFTGCQDVFMRNISLNKCFVDVDKSHEQLDISGLFADDIEIMPLEMSEECIISEMLKIQFTDDYIFVSDEVAQCVFQFFSDTGKYIKRIGHRGEGPTEYSSIGDFVVNEDYIYIQDLYKNKVLRYGLKDNSVETLLLKDFYMDEMIDFGSELYFVSNYRNYENGCFNLHKLNLQNNEITHLIPADAKVAENNSAWGLKGYSSKNKDSALIIYPLNDTIYTLTPDSLFPQMIVCFSERTLPKDMRYLDAMTLMERSTDYILGMNNIKNSDKYIFFEYTDRGLNKNVVIDKTTLAAETTERFVLEKWGDLYISGFEIWNNSFYLVQSAYFFRRSWNAIYSNKSFVCNKDRQAFKSLYDELNDDDNPVIFKLRMK